MSSQLTPSDTSHEGGRPVQRTPTERLPPAGTPSLIATQAERRPERSRQRAEPALPCVVAQTYEPSPPNARDLEVLDALQDRDGRLTEVELIDGRLLKVWNIAWGYDEGDSYAHVTTNISPSVEGAGVDAFFTHEVMTIKPR